MLKSLGLNIGKINVLYDDRGDVLWNQDYGSIARLETSEPILAIHVKSEIVFTLVNKMDNGPIVKIAIKTTPHQPSI